MKKKNIIVLLISCIFIVLLVASVPTVRTFVYAFTQAVKSKEPIDPYLNQIQSLQKDLQNPALSSDARILIEEKLNTISSMATQRALGKMNIPTRSAFVDATPTMVIAGMKLPDGIDDHPQIPFSESVVTVNNAWRKTTDQQFFLVFAGYLTENPEQGALMVYHPKVHTFFQILAPAKNGGLIVIDENKYIIQLQSVQGSMVYFNYQTEQFVDSDGTPIATPTQLTEPIITPEITQTPPYP